MYPYMENLDENIVPLIEEEKIPDLLFPLFKKNINNLKLILNDYVKHYKSFYLDISPYEELCKYDNYNIELILFVFVVLCAFENSNSLRRLQLICVNINYSAVFEIKKKINKLIDEKLADLSECKELETLNLNMAGISLLLDFNKLSVSLKKLFIDISTLRDMQELNQAFKNKKNELVNLAEVKLVLNLTENDQIFNELLKIFGNLPCNLENLKLTIENNIDIHELLQIFKAIHNNIDINLIEKKINISLHCNSKELESYLDDNRINSLIEYFQNNNANFIGKCKLNGELRRRNAFIFTLIKWPKKDILSSIILSFNKNVNKNEMENKEKIFSRIFNYMGKSQDFIVCLNRGN